MTLLDVVGPARALLDLVVTAAADEGIDLPVRRYITAGLSGAEAWDDEQVVVGITQLSPGNAARVGVPVGGRTSTPAGAPPVMAMALRVQIVRCTPTLDDKDRAPGAAELDAAGVQALRDASLLQEVLARIVMGAALTAGAPGDVLPGNITPAGPEGGLAGMSLTVAITAMARETS